MQECVTLLWSMMHLHFLDRPLMIQLALCYQTLLPAADLGELAAMLMAFSRCRGQMLHGQLPKGFLGLLLKESSMKLRAAHGKLGPAGATEEGAMQLQPAATAGDLTTRLATTTTAGGSTATAVVKVAQKLPALQQAATLHTDQRLGQTTAQAAVLLLYALSEMDTMPPMKWLQLFCECICQDMHALQPRELVMMAVAFGRFSFTPDSTWMVSGLSHLHSCLAGHR